MKRHIVALSFGKDSSAMALRLEEKNPNINYEFIFTPTGDELPPMVDHIRLVTEMLKGKVTHLKTEGLINVIRRKKMIPNFRARYCTWEVKLKPFVKFLGSLEGNPAVYVGIRADESARPGLQDKSVKCENPMVSWGWDINDVTAYLIKRGIKMPLRTGCGCCFNQRLGEWKALLDEYPDRYQEYVDLEEEMGGTFRSAGRDTWPAPLSELRAEFLSGRKLINRKPRGKK